MRARNASLRIVAAAALTALSAGTALERAQAWPAQGEDAADPVTRARAIIRDRNTTGITSAHFEILTDDPRVDAHAAADLLESFHAHVERVWSHHLTLKPLARPVPCFLVYSRHRFDRMPGAGRGAPAGAGHTHGGSGLAVLHTDALPPGDLPDLLIHEAAHRIQTERIFGEDAAPPPWVTEGLAVYYAHMKRDRDGRWHEDRSGDKGAALLRGGPSSGSFPWRRALSAWRKQVKAEETLPVDLLIRIREMSDFVSEEPAMRGMAAWNLVHFLMQGDSGRHRGAFARYVEAEARGEGGAETLYRLVGMGPEALQEAARAHARRL